MLLILQMQYSFSLIYKSEIWNILLDLYIALF